MRRACRCLFFVVAFAAAAIAYGQPIPQRALDQISALLREKASRTPVQQKIDSHLLYAHKMKHGLPIAVGVDRQEVSLQTDAADRVLVDIDAGFSKDLIQAIEAAGGSIVYAARNAQSMRAWLPLDSVEMIAGRKEVTFIQPAIPAMTQGAGDRKLRIRELATNISEGVVAHRVDQARATYGASGAGVKIGVMSDSVDFLSGVQATGDLPPNVTILPGQSGTGMGNSGEGTAMLEIVHDVAPDAQLYFATAFNGVAGFANNIIALRNAGCDIIVDDIFYFNESPFQDGPIAQAVNTVTAGGALYFSSAGNEGSVLKTTSGVWEGDFADSGIPIPGISGSIHLFSAPSGNSDPILPSGTHPVTLFWSDPLGASSNDYDLFLIDAAGAVVASSLNIQNGTQDPYEFVNNGFNPRKVVISKSAAAAPRFLHVTSIRGKLQIFTNGQTKGHACAADAYGVAAASALPVGPFTGASPAETFTSDGPRKMFYNPNGTLMNPSGGLLASGGAVRNKPDITAADGVSCATPGFSPFYGTSAAAPHAAAIAGLMKQMVPSATAAQIKSALTSTATDIENAGYDITTGFGIVNANAALAALGAVAQPFITLGTVTATPTIGNTAIDPGDNVNLTVSLSNGGGAAATVVQGVLTSTSPDVTINSATEPYPTIAASSSATNTVPFNFTVSPSAVCGSPIPFVLTVTFAQSAVPRVFNFTVATGGSGTPITFSFTGPPAAIPDNNPMGVSVPLTVSGVPSSIKKIQFRIDGSSCNTTPASPTVGIDHTWVGDLVIDLISPTGTTVNLINALTNGQDSNSGNNFCNTVLDDSASTPVQGLITSQAPFTGTFSPASPLSQFAGETANGTWTLHVVDIFAADTGSVRAWSLVITPAVCCPVLSVSPSTLPGGVQGILYNQTITASGGTAPYTFTLTGGALPSGVTLTSGGALSGTPTVTGSFSFTIAAVDANGCVGSRGYTINVISLIITSFTPDHGNTNTRVLLNGSGFTGVSSVTFNGVPASFTFLSDTQVRAIVPAGASTGLIAMTVPGGTGYSATNFTIVPQSTRTFVSVKGFDSDPCTVTQPCRTFNRALDVTLYGGVIVAKDSGGYGVTTIDKAVSIIAPPGVYASVTPTGTSAISINPTPGDVIALHGLTLTALGGATNGIIISNGAEVHLTNIVINGFNTGINATGAQRVLISDSVIRGSTLNGIAVSTTSGTTFGFVDQTRLEGNVQGINAGDGASITVRRSQISGNASSGIGVLASSITGDAQVTLERVTVSGTNIALQAGTSAQCVIRVSRSTICGNTVGVFMTGSGSVASLGNNTLEGNGTNGTFNALTLK